MTIPLEWFGVVILALLTSHIIVWMIGFDRAKRICLERARQGCNKSLTVFDDRGKIISEIMGKPEEWKRIAFDEADLEFNRAPEDCEPLTGEQVEHLIDRAMTRKHKKNNP